MKLVRILVEDGHLFDGTLEQFNDCFFYVDTDVATEAVIRAWAEFNNYTVEFFYD